MEKVSGGLSSPRNHLVTVKENTDVVTTMNSKGSPPVQNRVRSPANGVSRSRNARRTSKDGFESVQDVIFESMRETQRLRRRSDNLKESNTNMFLDTVEDLKVVASVTIASIKHWTNLHSHHEGTSATDDEKEISLRKQQDPNRMSDSVTSSTEQIGLLSHSRPQKDGVHIIGDMVWPFAFFGMPAREQLPDRNNLAPHIDRVKEAVSKAVKGDLNDAANDIWKFAAGAKDDDDNTVGTLDTLQEETNQIRRLGSWGTVNTSGTGGTNDTGFNSLEQGQTPYEINIDIEDDDGNTIDPILLQKAQMAREKRTPRREKVVKFDYPPIKSLRQCPRPDPQDLPALFFTEHELDQIEEDRYSTMSTDDIEIVAVSSTADDAQPHKARFKHNKSPKARHGSQTPLESPSMERHVSNGREQPETGWKQARGRSATPYRRRNDEDDEEADFPTHQPKSPSSSGRLVKGVQIYLRERSTGA